MSVVLQPDPAAEEAPTGTGPLVLAINNKKGGVGKSTTAACLAEALARASSLLIAERDFRVLAVDTDSQGDMSKALGFRSAEDRLPSLANALTLDTVAAPELALHRTRVPGLDLLTGSDNLDDIEQFLGQTADPLVEELRLRQLIDYLCSINHYDVVIIDCPPRGYSPIFSMAMRAADTYIVPVTLEYFAADGVAALFKAVNRFAEEHEYAPLLLGILLSRVDGRLRDTGPELAGMREQYNEYLLTTVIRENNAIRQAQKRDKSLFLDYRGSEGDRCYRSLAREIVKKCRDFRLGPTLIQAE
ncbi:MAG: ParA family protein [Gemmatimonadota bacterium]